MQPERSAFNIESIKKRGVNGSKSIQDYRKHNALVPTLRVGMQPERSAFSIESIKNGAQMGRSRYKIVENEKPCFLTASIVNWLPLFGKPAIAETIISSLKFLQDHNRLKVYACVIMENHLHLIAASENLGREITRFKSFTARKIIDSLISKNAIPILRELNYHKLRHKNDRQYQFWQEGSHPKMIQSDEMMIQKIEYIHNNPVKRGYVAHPTHWRYSSAVNYAGREGMLEICLFR